ncbi:MAG TPA: hypothetical protein VEB22_12585 [Phycisphaerales bacterium]|nr:hypothetical protein [Phycisphaerales bacterium]
MSAPTNGKDFAFEPTSVGEHIVLQPVVVSSQRTLSSIRLCAPYIRSFAESSYVDYVRGRRVQLDERPATVELIQQ